MSDELTEQGEPFACLVNGLLYPHQNTCPHMTTSPQHFCGEHAALSEAALCKLLIEAQVYISVHTHHASTHTHTVVTGVHLCAQHLHTHTQ